MAKKDKKADIQATSEEMTMEELEAIEAERAAKKKKKEENTDAGPQPEPQEPPMNPGNLPEEPPVENTDTVIITGDAENPIIIVVPNEPEPVVEAPESPVDGSDNSGGTDNGSN